MSDKSSSANPRTLCLYRKLDNGIHEFIMAEASRPAVDEFIDALDEMAQSLLPGKTAPILIDSSVGIQPLRYIFARTLTLLRGHSTPVETARMAMVLRPNVLINTIQVMMRIFPFINLRFFQPDEREQAIAWLLEPRHPRAF